MAEELQHRRRRVLDTISSLQSHFLQLYNSREVQCKLGYDSSPQCDLFQLGSMVRFFTRKGTLSLQSRLDRTDNEAQCCAGSVVELLKALKECPSYQIDGNHKHCGLRTRFIPLLDSIDPWQQVGLCLRCWKDDRSKESWLEAPSPEDWQPGAPRSNRAVSPCDFAHRRAKPMYTALRRNWTS